MKSTSRQQRYEQRNIDKRGLVKVCIWIPPAARDRVLAMADKLRKAAKRHES